MSYRALDAERRVKAGSSLLEGREFDQIRSPLLVGTYLALIYIIRVWLIYRLLRGGLFLNGKSSTYI